MKRLSNISKVLTAVLILLLISANVQAQDSEAVFHRISRSIQAGNSESLTTFFSSETVKVTTPEDDGTYSTQQAQFVMKKFFTEFPVKSFKIDHMGESGHTFYAQGTYQSAKGATLDANIFLKKIGDKFVVSSISFD